MGAASARMHGHAHWELGPLSLGFRVGAVLHGRAHWELGPLSLGFRVGAVHGRAHWELGPLSLGFRVISAALQVSLHGHLCVRCLRRVV